MELDVNFDFTTDTPGYWDNFWESDPILGWAGNDPDSKSDTLKFYHQVLWSKPLPNGEYMKLSIGKGNDYLTWKNFRFGSDSIIVSFRYKKYIKILEEVSQVVPDYQHFMETFLRKAYTMGGEIIFPKMKGGINQSRGCNILIKDRWDLTLECIRLHYLGLESPLSEVLNSNKDFFDLFVDFKGYVDFFHLQDCVSDDYEKVVFWLDHDDFTPNPLPQNTDEYLIWIERELQFVEMRNERIRRSLTNNNKMNELVDWYLKRCNVSTIDELSNEQAMRFLLDEHLGKQAKWYALAAQSAIKRDNLSEEVVIESIKKSMKTGKKFICGFIEHGIPNENYRPKKTGWFVEP